MLIKSTFSHPPPFNNFNKQFKSTQTKLTYKEVRLTTIKTIFNLIAYGVFKVALTFVWTYSTRKILGKFRINFDILFKRNIEKNFEHNVFENFEVILTKISEYFRKNFKNQKNEVAVLNDFGNVIIEENYAIVGEFHNVLEKTSISGE